MTVYPKPRIPLRPALSVQSFFSARGRRVANILDVKNQRVVTSGRVAFALALSELSVQAGDEVLVPAFHCTSMIEPVTWLKAQPVFYRIARDTSVDFEDLERRVTSATRALLVTHYFGFLQDITKLRALCDARGLALIEDCAHCLFGEIAGQPVGALSDYAIISLTKFFPTYDGGCLVSSRNTLDRVSLRSAGLAFDAKAAANALEYALEHGRLKWLSPIVALPLKVKDRLWHSVKGDAPIGPDSSDGGYGFDSAWVNKRASLAARIITATASLPRIYDLRRAHYLRLHEALRNLSGAEPLFHDLPEGIAPYVYPLKVAEPDRVFPALKHLGVPILRFGEYLTPEMPPETCPQTAEFSRKLLQFPCHQELTEDELDWMIDCIVRTFREEARKTA
ncbi:MAG: aminotransferase class I/II-fold pyridoxal phosphate-dependent enzyme [Burkholderiales bacterium]